MTNPPPPVERQGSESSSPEGSGHDLIDTHAQQDVDLDRVYMDVSVYNTRVMGPEHVSNVAHLACRTALTRRGVAHINFPTDTQYLPVKKGVRSERNIPGHNSDVFARSAGMPADEDIKRAADVLNKGKRVAILAGRGALVVVNDAEPPAAESPT